jgi:hypothetical protein
MKQERAERVNVVASFREAKQMPPASELASRFLQLRLVERGGYVHAIKSVETSRFVR